MLLQVILEGLGLGTLLVLVCAAGIRKGAVGMVHLYPMGQPFASIQSGLYVRLQRPERPFRQRFFRFLAKVGDNGMKMQIVKIGFGGKK